MTEFDWKIISLTEDGVRLNITFTYPLYISSKDLDKMLISFYNTDNWMIGQTGDVLPEGYTMNFDIPPQGGDFEVVALKITEQATTSIIAANFFLSIVLGLSLQQIWGAINSFSILAHMPLIKVSLPGSCFFIFDLLILFVTFDFFPIADIFDFGYTITDPWNDRFEWTGYGSVNFVENMGSLILFLSVILGRFTVWFLQTKCCKTFWLKTY